VLDVREAMTDGAPILHEDLRTRDAAPLSTGTADKQTNVAAHNQMKLGDIEQGFAESDIIIEREFTTPMYHQGYIEPQTAVAYWNKDGHITFGPARRARSLPQHACECAAAPDLPRHRHTDGNRRRLRR